MSKTLWLENAGIQNEHGEKVASVTVLVERKNGKDYLAGNSPTVIAEARQLVRGRKLRKTI